MFDAHSVLRARGFNAAYTFQFGAGTRAPHALAAVRAAAPMLRDFFRTKLPAGLQSAAHVGLGPVIPSKVAEAGAPLGVELQIWLSASALAALGSRLPPSAVALASVPTQLLGQPGDPPLVAGLRSVDVTATEAVVAGLPPSIAGCGDFEAVLAFLRLVYGPQLGPQVLEVLGVTDGSVSLLVQRRHSLPPVQPATVPLMDGRVWDGQLSLAHRPRSLPPEYPVLRPPLPTTPAWAPPVPVGDPPPRSPPPPAVGALASVPETAGGMVPPPTAEARGAPSVPAAGVGVAPAVAAARVPPPPVLAAVAGAPGAPSATVAPVVSQAGARAARAAGAAARAATRAAPVAAAEREVVVRALVARIVARVAAPPPGLSGGAAAALGSVARLLGRATSPRGGPCGPAARSPGRPPSAPRGSRSPAARRAGGGSQPQRGVSPPRGRPPAPALERRARRDRMEVDVSSVLGRRGRSGSPLSVRRKPALPSPLLLLPPPPVGSGDGASPLLLLPPPPVGGGDGPTPAQ